MMPSFLTCGELALRMKATFAGDLMLAVFWRRGEAIVMASQWELKAPQKLNAAMTAD